VKKSPGDRKKLRNKKSSKENRGDLTLPHSYHVYDYRRNFIVTDEQNPGGEKKENSLSRDIRSDFGEEGTRKDEWIEEKEA